MLNAIEIVLLQVNATLVVTLKQFIRAVRSPAELGGVIKQPLVLAHDA